MVKLIKSIFIISFPLFLLSCLTIDAQVSFSKDLSGVFQYDASISTLAADLEQIDKEKNIIPFPLLRESVDRALNLTVGLTVDSWKIADDGTRYFAQSAISFTNPDSLGQFTGLSFNIEERINSTILTVLLYSPSESEVPESVRSIVKEKFPDDYIQLQTIVPGSIIRTEGATFSGSTVTIRKTIVELLDSSEDIQFSVEYR